MTVATTYQYLAPRQGSKYQQFFLKGTNTRAEIIYRETVGTEPRTPEQVAEDRNLPLEAVLECIHYCENNEELLRRERDEELAMVRRLGLDKPPLAPPQMGSNSNGPLPR